MSTLVDSIRGRLGNGRFAAGNPGGPGNPNVAQTAKLRRALFSCMTEEEMVVIFRALIEKAKEGNIQAIKMVLLYTVGKPGAIGAPIGNGDIGEIEPIGNGINGESTVAKVAPTRNGVNGGNTACLAEIARLANGEIGGGISTPDSFGTVMGQKMSGRALRKLRKAAKLAELRLAGR